MKYIQKILFILFYLVVFVGVVLVAITKPLLAWFQENFGVSFSEIYYTITGPLKGADTDFLIPAIATLKSAALVIIAFTIAIVFIERVFGRLDISIVGKVGKLSGFRINLAHLYRAVIMAVVCIALFIQFLNVDNTLGITRFIDERNNSTTIYEENYVDPNTVNITAPKQKRNLIMIYLESMETTYAPQEVGGAQPVPDVSFSIIPGLTWLAEDNISFSNTDKLGGFHSLTGTGWTYSSLFAQSSGIPYAFNSSENNVAKGVTTIGDILADEGYNQEFLCGSDASFAARGDFFKQHGGYEIFDYNTAVEKGYIPEGYYVWWGFEDKYLYQIAKDEATRLASEDKPFNLTFLTVDTHHQSGYVCDLCDTSIEPQLASVVDCADNQIEDFVRWCMKQDFYEDTTIVIVGDHPRMDMDLVGGVDYYDRTVYNCYINAKPHYDAKAYTNREFSAMETFPTVLSSLGFEIDGNRLGLGVDMFSGEETLMEKMGYEELNTQLNGYSEYYNEHFY